MKEYTIYEDANGIQYVKGNIGGGYTIYSTEMGVWNYCSIPEEVIAGLCKNTGKTIKL